METIGWRPTGRACGCGKRSSRVEMHLDDETLQRIKVAKRVKLYPVGRVVKVMINTEMAVVIYLEGDHTWHF